MTDFCSILYLSVPRFLALYTLLAVAVCLDHGFSRSGWPDGWNSPQIEHRHWIKIDLTVFHHVFCHPLSVCPVMSDRCPSLRNGQPQVGFETALRSGNHRSNWLRIQLAKLLVVWGARTALKHMDGEKGSLKHSAVIGASGAVILLRHGDCFNALKHG